MEEAVQFGGRQPDWNILEISKKKHNVNYNLQYGFLVFLNCCHRWSWMNIVLLKIWNMYMYYCIMYVSYLVRNAIFWWKSPSQLGCPVEKLLIRLTETESFPDRQQVRPDCKYINYTAGCGQMGKIKIYQAMHPMPALVMRALCKINSHIRFKFKGTCIYYLEDYEFSQKSCNNNLEFCDGKIEIFPFTVAIKIKQITW